MKIEADDLVPAAINAVRQIRRHDKHQDTTPGSHAMLRASGERLATILRQLGHYGGDTQ